MWSTTRGSGLAGTRLGISAANRVRVTHANDAIRHNAVLDEACAEFCVLSSPPATETRVFCAAFQTRPSGIIRRCAAGLEVAKEVSSYGNGMARLM